MAGRALLVGIDNYDNVSGLQGCVKDATQMAAALSRHENGDPNYDCQLYVSGGPDRITRAFLREQISALFDSFDGEVLLFFAGHGASTTNGGVLVTQDGETGDLGVSMDDLLNQANQSSAKEVLLILDCCYSGNLGNPSGLQGSLDNRSLLREGVTILAASRPTQTSAEFNGHGIFTSLVLNALYGGAADVIGNVSAASIYAFAEQALGAWDQRPLYKSHASRLSPVRKCHAEVPSPVLHRLPEIFPDPTGNLSLDPTYEHTDASAIADNVDVFDCLKTFRNSRLLRTIDEDTDRGDLYFACMKRTGVRLTGLGRYYWRLVRDGRV